MNYKQSMSKEGKYKPGGKKKTNWVILTEKFPSISNETNLNSLEFLLK